MTAQSIMPKGLPALPENVNSAREQVMQQYKKIPKFDDLDESNLDAWELPDLGSALNSGGSFGKSSGGGSFGKSSGGGNNPAAQRYVECPIF